MQIRNRKRARIERNTRVPELIGSRIRELRRCLGLSQRDLQQKAGLMRCYISRLENGHTVPTLQIVQRLATALELPLYFVFHESAEPAERDSFCQSSLEESMQGKMSGDSHFLRRLGKFWRRMTDHDREMLALVAARMAARLPDLDQQTINDHVSSEASESMQYVPLTTDGCIVSTINNSVRPDS
jgi:transcriptional regulator with XRE-family HTH domain